MKNISREKKQKENNQSLFTTETFGVVLMLFASLALVCLISRAKVFGAPGLAIAEFLLGILGYFSYPITAFAIFYGFLLVSGKKTGVSLKRKFLYTATFLIVMFLIHAITMHSQSGLEYNQYLSASYNKGTNDNFVATGGGWMAGLATGFLVKILSQTGVYVVLSAIILLFGYAIIKTPKQKQEKIKVEKQQFNGTFADEPKQAVAQAPVENVTNSTETIVQQNNPTSKQKLFVADPNSFALKNRRDIKNADQQNVQFSYTNNGLVVPSSAKTYSNSYDNEIQSKLNYIKTPAKIDVESITNSTNNSSSINVSDYLTQRNNLEVSPATSIESEKKAEESIIPLYEHNQTETETRAENFSEKYASIEETTEETPSLEPIEQIFPVEIAEDVEEISPKLEVVEESQPAPSLFESKIVRDIFANENKEEKEEQIKEEPISNPEPPVRIRGEESPRRFGFGERARPAREIPQEIVKEETEEKIEKEIPPINREYFRPSLDLLESYTPPVDLPKENHEEKKEIIRQTLEEFGISVEPQNHIQGPSITRYEIKMPAGVSVKRVLQYDYDLQMRLAARNGVRIEAPIPGKNLVGIEVANSSSVMVGLKEVLMGMAGQNFKPDSLIFALGKDIVGNSKFDDLAKGPHYLIAGSSGSGKSVCLNVMICSLIMRYSPEELRFILIDPKRVEMRKYEHIPHLMVDEIITEPKKALAVLQWAIEEMERRYAMFEQAGSFIDGIAAYNQNVASDTVPKMPKIVIVIDEFGDLMANVKKDLEVKIQILTQKARAAGIHIVLATQRPSANVVTGVIKTNLPSRIAFKVGNYTDSMIILDGKGAEKLLGNGDMLYKNSTMPDTERYQGAFISAREINNVVSYIIEKNKAYFDQDLKEYLDKADKPKQEEREVAEESEGSVINDANADLLKRALALAINAGAISISQVQRRFQIGYIRAAGIIDKMEEFGYISGNEGSKNRKVYITREQFEEKYGPMSD